MECQTRPPFVNQNNQPGKSSTVKPRQPVYGESDTKKLISISYRTTGVCIGSTSCLRSSPSSAVRVMYADAYACFGMNNGFWSSSRPPYPSSLKAEGVWRHAESAPVGTWPESGVGEAGAIVGRAADSSSASPSSPVGGATSCRILRMC